MSPRLSKTQREGLMMIGRYKDPIKRIKSTNLWSCESWSWSISFRTMLVLVHLGYLNRLNDNEAELTPAGRSRAAELQKEWEAQKERSRIRAERKTTHKKTSFTWRAAPDLSDSETLRYRCICGCEMIGYWSGRRVSPYRNGYRPGESTDRRRKKEAKK